jgi:hypothetical protein
MYGMRFRLRTLLIVLALAPPVLAIVAIALLGLRQTPPSATGTVTFRGKPVADGIIEFVSESDRRRYTTKTDDQGRYHGDGSQIRPPLQPGRYRVNILIPGKGAQLESQLVTDLQPESEIEIHFELQ